MNTRKHTIRSAFLIFLCMMLMMCITACGEKETKEYPELVIDHVNLSKDGISYELDMPLIKKIDKNIYTNIGSRDVSEFLDGDVQIISDDRVSWQLAGHKEYPDIGLEVRVKEEQNYNVQEEVDKELQGSPSKPRVIGEYVGDNCEGYLYRYRESNWDDTYVAYIVKPILNGHLCVMVMVTDAKDAEDMVDYVLTYFKNEFGELKFEKV